MAYCPIDEGFCLFFPLFSFSLFHLPWFYSKQETHRYFLERHWWFEWRAVSSDNKVIWAGERRSLCRVEVVDLGSDSHQLGWVRQWLAMGHSVVTGINTGWWVSLMGGFLFWLGGLLKASQAKVSLALTSPEVSNHLHLWFLSFLLNWSFWLVERKKT